MKWSLLRRLLDKYFDGSSSPEEEKKILELIGQENLPDEFSDDKMMITGLFGRGEIPEPSTDLEERIMNVIDESEKRKRLISGKRSLYSIISVAAAVLIIISFWFILDNNGRIKDTYSDPQLAYNETVEVLFKVSANLNKGVDQLADLSMINQTKTRLNLIPESRDAVIGELKALKYIENGIKLFGNDNKNEQDK